MEYPTVLITLKTKILMLLYHNIFNTSESNGLDRPRLTLHNFILFILYMAIGFV